MKDLPRRGSGSCQPSVGPGIWGRWLLPVPPRPFLCPCPLSLTLCLSPVGGPEPDSGLSLTFSVLRETQEQPGREHLHLPEFPLVLLTQGSPSAYCGHLPFADLLAPPQVPPEPLAGRGWGWLGQEPFHVQCLRLGQVIPTDRAALLGTQSPRGHRREGHSGKVPVQTSVGQHRLRFPALTSEGTIVTSCPLPAQSLGWAWVLSLAQEVLSRGPGAGNSCLFVFLFCFCSSSCCCFGPICFFFFCFDYFVLFSILFILISSSIRILFPFLIDFLGYFISVWIFSSLFSLASLLLVVVLYNFFHFWVSLCSL
nr:uncharacterized protein LOC127487029 [Oryctolagus cuniculus]